MATASIPLFAAEIRDTLEHVFRILEAKNDYAELARQINANLEENGLLPEELRAAWEEGGRLSRVAALAGTPLDRDALGRKLTAAFDSGLSLLLMFRDWSTRAKGHGSEVPAFSRLEARIAEVESLRSQALDAWPWTPAAADVERMVAECEGGDSTSLDETFARAAGMTEEAWGRLIEERRRQRGVGAGAP
jgi:hypothetical protein